VPKTGKGISCALTLCVSTLLCARQNHVTVLAKGHRTGGLIYGERDMLVPAGLRVGNIESALQSGKNRDYTILILPRASHGLSINPEPGQSFEWWHLALGHPDLLTAWLNKRMK